MDWRATNKCKKCWYTLFVLNMPLDKRHLDGWNSVNGILVIIDFFLTMTINLQEFHEYINFEFEYQILFVHKLLLL